MKLTDLLSICLYPRRCKLCGDMVEFDKEYCDKCKGEDSFVIEEPVCLFCGNSKSDCICKDKKHYYKSVVAPFYYEGRIKHAVYNFKFNRYTYMSKDMAESMKLCFDNHYLDIKFDFVTDVPLHRKRERERGFNQSRLLAEDLASMLGVPYKSLLKKIINNGLQHKQTLQSRKINVYGAYDLKKGVTLDGKTVLLVDDIKTTGATLNECAKMLLLCGADKVYALTYSVTRAKKESVKNAENSLG